MKIAAIVFLSLAIIFLGVKIISFWGQERSLNAQLDAIQAQLAKTQTQGAYLQQDVQYLANPANLEKELRSRFNYKKPGENMVIIVPNETSTATSSQ